MVGGDRILVRDGVGDWALGSGCGSKSNLLADV